MHLKKLELNGFKSFAFPTTLELSPGVTAIVGPNGSGKSNIADAVRWILGEQSMKNIRSQSSKDLIFSGSKSKNKLGKASVSLCLDNQDGKIPLDYTEIVITREIFRDGTSEYFINKKSARLMDVVEILAKANIGSKGFSVINQGMESEILKYSPSELYELLEDASGVRYLQLKKKRAERRLKSTQTNIEKTTVVLRELLPHLNFLKREANKARKKEELKKELSNLQKKFFGSKIKSLEKQKQTIEKDRTETMDRIAELEQEIINLSEKAKEEEERIISSRKKLFDAQKKIEEILNKRTVLNDKLAELKAQIQIEQNAVSHSNKMFLNIDTKELEEELEKVYSELKTILEIESLEKIKGKVQEIITRIEKIIRKPEYTTEEQDSKQEKLSKLKKEYSQIEKSLKELQEEYNKQKQFLRADQDRSEQEEFFVLEKRLRRKKDEAEELKSRLREIDWNFEKINREIEQIKEDIKLTGLDYHELKKETKEHLGEEENREIEEKINRLKYKLEEIGGIDELTLKEYEETKERYDNLSEKLQDLNKAKKDLEAMIERLTQEIRTQFEGNLEIINENFNKYFRLLFNGGRASLKQTSKSRKLLDDYTEREQEMYKDKEQESQEEDKIEAVEKYSKGIEIKASLPGKKVKNLRMFSGGEKALTSIALLFAIISANPPSFLVLDEVDATLDESNARRFARLLKEFSKNTQFIIITHNRETMNQADVLYGVTMGEEGISKVFSLKLEKE